VRLLRIGVVLAAVAATLTACSPGRQPLLAVTVVHGAAVAILHTCTNGPAEISVTENSQAPTTPPASGSPSVSPTATPSPTQTITPPTETYVYFWSVKIENAPMVNEVPLFFTPVGWELAGHTLSKLQPGARYIADAKVTGVFDVSPVNFTLADLAELKEGDVIYGINAPLTTTLTRAEFDQKAAQACTETLPSTSPA
jgi:hypothetical protein